MEQLEYDAVLMDCQLPDMDGFQATAEIRRLEQQSGGHVPILAMTANAMRGDREQCVQAGMDDYLPKPVRSAELSALLRHWVIPGAAAGRSRARDVGTESLIVLPVRPIVSLAPPVWPERYA